MQALVLTGSSADSYRDPDWNVQLKARLASAVKRQQRILGICYGHQLMARVLGGETGKYSTVWFCLFVLDAYTSASSLQ